MRIQQIADRCQTSVATVSRALRNRGGVGEDKRRHIVSVAQEMGYRVKNSMAVGHHQVTMVVRGASSVDTTNELFQRFLMAATARISELGWQVNLAFVPHELDVMLLEPERYPPALKREADGCLTIGSVPEQARERLAKRYQNNVVMIARSDLSRGCSGVEARNPDGGMIAGEHLMNLGHRRLAWLGSAFSKDVALDRYWGVERAMRAAGGRFVADLWCNELMSPGQFEALVTPALTAPTAQRATAWVCSSDWIAAQLIELCLARGIRIPQDLSIITFDNNHVSQARAGIRMTTVVMPREQMAQAAVDLLAQRFAKPDALPVAWSFPMQLREGLTTVRLEN